LNIKDKVVPVLMSKLNMETPAHYFVEFATVWCGTKKQVKHQQPPECLTTDQHQAHRLAI
jgi:hypothetical protein